MRVNAAIMADFQRRRIRERDATALTEARAQVSAQWNGGLWHQLDKAVVGNQSGKGPQHVLEDVLLVIILEITIPGAVKEHDNGHHFG